MLDCHCHLLDAGVPPAVFFDSLSGCHVTKFYCNTTRASQWSVLSAAAVHHPQIIPFYGIHPWHITPAQAAGDLQLLAALLEDDHCFCGEIGLDRLCATDFSLQEEIFIRQLDIAMSTKSFVAIHCVKAWGRVLEILASYQGKINFMIHGFHGSREVMERLVAMGGMISFSDRVIQSSRQRLQDVLRVTPLENLFLETDFPAHKGDKGPGPKTYCQHITPLYLFVSRLRHVPLAELVQIIDRNGSLSTY